MQMKFNFHQVDPSQALMAYIRDELEKIGRHLHTESSVTVFCRLGGYNCEVQLEVNSAWGHFRASHKTKDFYQAADGAVEKLGKQFQRTKEKHQHHKKPQHSKEARLSHVNEALEYREKKAG